MLARNAEALYWIGRYVERADDTARILDVAVHQLLEDSSVDPDQASRLLLRVLGIEPPDHELDVWSLTDLVAFSTNSQGGSSIVDAISAARENAKSARKSPPARRGSVSTPPITPCLNANALPNALGRTSFCRSSRAVRRCLPAWPIRRFCVTTDIASCCLGARLSGST